MPSPAITCGSAIGSPKYEPSFGHISDLHACGASSIVLTAHFQKITADMQCKDESRMSWRGRLHTPHDITETAVHIDTEGAGAGDGSSALGSDIADGCSPAKDVAVAEIVRCVGHAGRGRQPHHALRQQVSIYNLRQDIVGLLRAWEPTERSAKWKSVRIHAMPSASRSASTTSVRIFVGLLRGWKSAAGIRCHTGDVRHVVVDKLEVK